MQRTRRHRETDRPVREEEFDLTHSQSDSGSHQCSPKNREGKMRKILRMLEKDIREIERKALTEPEQPILCMEIEIIAIAQVDKHKIVKGTITPFTRVLIS